MYAIRSYYGALHLSDDRTDALPSHRFIWHLDAVTETIGLADLPDAANRILEGRIRGRIVVDVRK